MYFDRVLRELLQVAKIGGCLLIRLACQVERTDTYLLQVAAMNAMRALQDAVDIIDSEIERLITTLEFMMDLDEPVDQ